MARDYEIKTTFRAKDKATREIGKIQNKLVKMTAKASMGFRKLNRVMSKATSMATRGLKYGFATGTIAATGLYMAINRTAASMDTLAKRARTIDFPIEEFQEWRFVAEQSGVETSVFEKSMQKFARVIGDLKNGTGSLYTVLKKNDKQLFRTVQGTENTIDAFDLMVDAIRKVEDPTKKASLAAATFGRAGVDMVNMVNLGSKEIAKLRAEMRENGVVTAEQAAKAEAYNDMMNRVKKTVGALAVDAIAPLLPMFTEWSDKTRQLIVDNRGLIKSKVAEYVKEIPGYIEKIIYWAPKIGKLILIFYAVSTAVKVANTSMAIFNTLANVNLGPMKAMGAFMGKALPMKIGASTAAMTALQGAMVLGVGAAAVGLGLLIHKHILDPLMKARHEASMMKAEHDQTMKGDLSKRNSAMLKGDVEKADKVIKDTKRSFNGGFAPMPYAPAGFDPMAGARNEAVSQAERDKERLQAALYHRQQVDNIGRYDNGPGQSDEWSISTSQQSTTHKEEVEVTIKDETGRAKVTKGKSRNLTLAHTGGMP